MDNSLRKYSFGQSEGMRGEPLFSTLCSYRRPGEMQVDKVSLVIFANGFRALLRSGAEVDSTTFVAFTLLSEVHSSDGEESESILRLTVFNTRSSTIIYAFVFHGEHALAECKRLVEAVDNALTLFTLSLFPCHTIAVVPIPNAESTHHRIMAGYLLMFDEWQEEHLGEPKDGSVCAVYGELGSFHSGSANFIIYTNDRCTSVVDTFNITEDVTVLTYDSTYCRIFELDCCRFCTRTRAEMLLWTRALINVKMKLLFRAPDPTADDLEVFRSAVLERVVQLEIAPSTSGALLPLKPRPPLPSAVQGDKAQLDPMDCDESSLPSISDLTSSNEEEAQDV